MRPRVFIVNCSFYWASLFSLSGDLEFFKSSKSAFDLIKVFIVFMVLAFGVSLGYHYHRVSATIGLGIDVTCRCESTTVFHCLGMLPAMILQSTPCWSMSTTVGKLPAPFTSLWTRASRMATWASRPMSGDQSLGLQGHKSLSSSCHAWIIPHLHPMQFNPSVYDLLPVPHFQQLLERIYYETKSVGEISAHWS